MLIELIYEFFIKYIFGGFYSGRFYSGIYLAGVSDFESDYFETNFILIKFSDNFIFTDDLTTNYYNNGYFGVMTMGNYLSLIASIITISIIVIITFSMIYKLFKGFLNNIQFLGR